MTNEHVLQILPRLPNGHDGVADYAAKLAHGLSIYHRMPAVFAPAQVTDATELDGFKVVPLNHLHGAGEYRHVLLHFVNYGYAKRGVPSQLLSILRKVRAHCRGNFVTIFHELYASAPPWKSAFWLRPFQIRIARSIAEMSDACLVSNDAALEQLRHLCPNVRAAVHPVCSNLGEPNLSPGQITDRDPHRWIICGGTEMVERALRSFCKMAHHIPEFAVPRELMLIGGKDNPAVRKLIVDLANIRAEYHPNIDAAVASPLLATCAFGWIDYFHRADVPASVIFKSGVFAALCAHAVIPIFPHPLAQASETIPARYYISDHERDIPPDDARPRIAEEAYRWYHHHASSAHLADEIAAMLKANRP